MNIERLQEISDKFKKLIALDKEDFEIFGSDSHDYVVNPVLSEDEIHQFEMEHDIFLPEEYRAFLMQIGNGGAGPFYGLLSLDDNDGCETDYADEFPYTRTNPLNLMDIYEQIDLILEEKAIENEDERDEERDRIFEEYYKSAIKGIKVLTHEGCGMYSVLVVKGAEYGNIWFLDFANDVGAFPYTSPKTKDSVKFFEWFEIWLDRAIACKESGTDELASYSDLIQ